MSISAVFIWYFFQGLLFVNPNQAGGGGGFWMTILEMVGEHPRKGQLQSIGLKMTILGLVGDGLGNGW